MSDRGPYHCYFLLSPKLVRFQPSDEPVYLQVPTDSRPSEFVEEHLAMLLPVAIGIASHKQTPKEHQPFFAGMT